MSGTGTLSEAASKTLLRAHGMALAERARGDQSAVAQSRLPTSSATRSSLKLCGAAIAHKTERGLVRLRLGDGEAVAVAAAELLDRATPADGLVSLLVAPMVAGNRELIAGVVRDPQFGANIMLGVGGIIAEAIADVQFRPAPDHASSTPPR